MPTTVCILEKKRETVKRRDVEGGRDGGREVDLSIKGDHILATEPLSHD